MNINDLLYIIVTYYVLLIFWYINYIHLFAYNYKENNLGHKHYTNCAAGHTGYDGTQYRREGCLYETYQATPTRAICCKGESSPITR